MGGTRRHRRSRVWLALVVSRPLLTWAWLIWVLVKFFLSCCPHCFLPLVSDDGGCIDLVCLLGWFGLLWFLVDYCVDMWSPQWCNRRGRILLLGFFLLWWDWCRLMACTFCEQAVPQMLDINDVLRVGCIMCWDPSIGVWQMMVSVAHRMVS